jgi:Fur family ferric uptake transcriptional regulator
MELLPSQVQLQPDCARVDSAATARYENGMKKRAPNDLAELQAPIRQAGLRSTGPRVAVLRLLRQADAPRSHAEIVEAVASEGFDRATLYRNLVDMAEAGLLSRSDLGDHVWRFELRGEKTTTHLAEHPHFVCTDCGDVACLPEAEVRIKPGPGRPRAVARKAVEVQIKGRCDDCA